MVGRKQTSKVIMVFLKVNFMVWTSLAGSACRIDILSREKINAFQAGDNLDFYDAARIAMVTISLFDNIKTNNEKIKQLDFYKLNSLRLKK